MGLRRQKSKSWKDIFLINSAKIWLKDSVGSNLSSKACLVSGSCVLVSSWAFLTRHLFVLGHSGCDLAFPGGELLVGKSVKDLNVGHVATAMHIMPDAVLDLALAALDERQVGEVCAILALVSILHHLISIFHHRHRLVSLWKLRLLLYRHPCAHFSLHEGSLTELKVHILIEFGLYDRSRGSIYVDTI